MSSRPVADDWSLRPAGPEDDEFLFQVYAGTRAEELAATGWTADQREGFLRMQFAFQDHHYRSGYANARFDVITMDGIPAGRLYVDRGPEEIRIMDLALLPDYRGAGIGTAALTALIAEGCDSGRPVTVHVEKANRALGLYRRLGFVPVAEGGTHLLLEVR